VWRQNAGLSLVNAVTGGDVVTVSYTSGVNKLRSVDGIEVPSFTGRAVTNISDTTGGPNPAYPVVEFTNGVRRTLTGGGLAESDSQVGTLALLRFRFPALPAADVDLIGDTSGTPGFRLLLRSNGQLELRIANAAGTAQVRVQLGAANTFAPNTDYDIFISLDLAQATAAAGCNCYANGNAIAVSGLTWVAGGSAGWTRAGFSGTLLNHGNATFRFGAFYLNTATRLDLTNSANRDKFFSVTAGNLDILTRGNGITGALPAQFLVGSAAQWNDAGGMNRGSAAGRFFVTSGATTLISGADWI